MSKDTISIVTGGKADILVKMEHVDKHGNEMVWKLSFVCFCFVREWKQDDQLIGGGGGSEGLPREEKV